MNPVTKTVRIDLANPGGLDFLSRVYAVRGDSGSRKICFSLYSNGVEYTPPGETTCQIAGLRPDGTVVPAYSTIARGGESRTAYTISGNLLTVELSDAICQKAGDIAVTIAMAGPDGARLSVWPVCCHIEQSAVAASAESPDLPSEAASTAADRAAAAADKAEAAARRAEQYGPQALVNSVNGRTGEVTLTASDVGASPAGHTHTAADVSGLPASLPNPNALTLQLGANDAVVYDGSAEKTLPVAGRVQFAYNGSGSAVYSVFARMRAGSPCTMNFLVADTKAIMASATSTMLVGCTQYTDGTLHMTAHLLDFTSTPYAKFGYYLQDGVFYIGVRRGAYCSATSAVLLSDWGADCTDFGDFGTVDIAPEGWTAIETQMQPTVTVSTTDITAGSTSLASGAFYVVYE